MRKVIWIPVCALSMHLAVGQNATQWYGWQQCLITVDATQFDANGTIIGQYFHQETQTWQLAGSPTGQPATDYPATWNVVGSGWNSATGLSWTLNSPVLSAPFTIYQRASDNDWLIKRASSQLSDKWAITTPVTMGNVTSEYALPSVTGQPQATSIYDASYVTDPAGKYGILQPGGTTSHIYCTWKFAKGSIPPSPPTPSISGSQLKPPTAPAGSVFVPIPPCRVVDTRVAHSSNPRGPTLVLPPTAPYTFQIAGLGNNCGIPALGPTALSLNVAAIPLEPLTALSIRPIGQAESALPLLSATDGLPTANAVILPFGSGAVEVSVTNRTYVVIDANGYFMPANTSAGNAFYPVRPCQALATTAPLAAGVQVDVDLRTPCGIPTWATALVMDVAVAPPSPLGFLSVWAAGQARPETSNINASDGQKKSNMVIAQTGTNGRVSFFASEATNASAVVVGYFGTPGFPGALTFHPMPACTAGNSQVDGPPVLPPGREFAISQTGVCGVPSWARAYSLNFIVTPFGPLAELDVRPSGTPSLTAWSLYAGDGQVTASSGVIAAGTGGMIAMPASPTHLMVIVNGYFN